MGVWLELRCDEMSSPKCWSGRNKGPMEMSQPNIPSVVRTLRLLGEEARRKGWAYTKRGRNFVWLCPECYGAPPTEGTEPRTPAASSPPPSPAR